MEDFNVSKYFREKLLEQEDVMSPEDDDAESAFTKEPEQPKEPEQESDEFDAEKVAKLKPEFEKLMAQSINNAFNSEDEIEHINARNFLSKIKAILADQREINDLLNDATPEEAAKSVLIFAGDDYFKEIIDQQNLTSTNPLNDALFELYTLFDDPIRFYSGTVERHMKGYIKNKNK